MNNRILIFSVIMMMFCSLSSFAQNLTVNTEREDGKSTETKIIFKSTKEDKHVDIYRMTSVSSSWSMGSFGGMTGGTFGMGENMQFVCSTPAELTLDKGEMYLQAVHSGVSWIKKKFKIKATGGTQTITIRPPSLGLVCGGIAMMTLSVFTFSAALPLIILGACDVAGHYKYGYRMSFGGYGSLIAGIVCMTSSAGLGVGSGVMCCYGYPKITLLSIEF